MGFESPNQFLPEDTETPKTEEELNLIKEGTENVIKGLYSGEFKAKDYKDLGEERMRIENKEGGVVYDDTKEVIQQHIGDYNARFSKEYQAQIEKALDVLDAGGAETKRGEEYGDIQIIDKKTNEILASFPDKFNFEGQKNRRERQRMDESEKKDDGHA